MPDQTVLTAGLVFLAVSLGTISLALVAEWIRGRARARNVVKQLKQFAEETIDGDAGELLIRRDQERNKGALDPALSRLPSFRDISVLLERGETNWSLQTFLFLTIGFCAAGMAAGWLLTRFVPVAAMLGFAGAVSPYLYARRRARKRLGDFEAQLPDAIDLIGRAIRAGHPLSAGLKMVADETKPPIAGEFRRVFEEQRFGLGFEESMYALADRVPIVDTRILITAILVQREVGGNLAEILDNLAYVIRERFKIRRQLRVITAQGRMSGYVLAVLPIAVGFAIFLLNREYVLLLFTHPLGKVLLVAAIVFQILGYLWIRKIVDIEI